jgi:hypothetical protein
MTGIGWVFIAIGIPVFGPIIVNMTFWFLPAEVLAESERKWYVPVKDGQLFWVVIALAANALYELPGATFEAKGWIEGLFILAVVASAILGAIGAIWPSTPDVPTATSFRKYGLLAFSVIFILATGGLATLVHINVTGAPT